MYLKWPFGHPLGEPFNRAQQLSVIHYALRALVAADQPDLILDPGWGWRREQYEIPQEWRAD